MRSGWLLAVPAAMLIAQNGCKPKAQPEAAPSAAPAAVSAPAATQSAAPEQPAASEAASAAPAPTAELGNAKRYPHQEKVSTGTVRVLENDVKVFNEPDDKTPDVALLSKDLMVYRIATIGDDWTLVEFPAGVGKVAPGWVPTKTLDVKVNTAVKEDAIAKQTKTAKALAPVSSAVASASAAPASTTAPAASGSAKTATTTAPKTGTATTTAGTAKTGTTAGTAKTGTTAGSTKTTTTAH